MSIDLKTATQPVASAFLQRDVALSNPKMPDGVEKGASDINTAAKVRISALTQQIMADDSQDVDMERVTKIQQAISSGEYTIDSDRIADTLIGNILRPW